MNIEFSPPAPNLIPEAVYASIVSDVSTALNSLVTVDQRFVVNDTIWRKRATKNNRSTLNPVVVNQADFITKGLEIFLEDNLGWERQKTLVLPGDNEEVNQVFDAYKAFGGAVGARLVNEEAEKRLLLSYLNTSGPRHMADFARKIAANYRDRGCFILSPDLQVYNDCFASSQNTAIRVAIETETGNIASSFRSIHKLGALFQAGQIDVGILITSARKQGGATSIWPSSNRNGSIEELNQRCAFSNLSFPLIRVGFMPDALSRTAPYLKDDGTTYTIEPIEIVTINNVRYLHGRTEIHGDIYTEA